MRNTEEAMPLNSETKAQQLDDPSSWVDRYGDSLLRFALSRVARREVAEDLVQETLLAAWLARDSFDGRASVGTWMCGILRRKITDHYRRVGRERTSMEAEASDEGRPLFSKRGKWLESLASWRDSPEALTQNSEFWIIVARCLASLPVHLAEAFQLREICLASIDDVCMLTGVTPKNLSVRLHRARLLMRRCLDQKWFRGGA